MSRSQLHAIDLPEDIQDTLRRAEGDRFTGLYVGKCPAIVLDRMFEMGLCDEPADGGGTWGTCARLNAEGTRLRLQVMAAPV